MFRMRSWLKRQALRLLQYLLSVSQRQLTAIETELQKHQDSVTLFGFGVLCLAIGRFTGLTYVSLIGALGLAVGFLKALK